MESPCPRHEVADVIRLFGDAYIRDHATTLHQRQVLFRLTACRTVRLGGHVHTCPACPDVQVISYNSCRDRHCPKCQGRERMLWVERSLARILAIPHFHVVFTLPDTLSPLILRNPRPLYNLLFQASSQALLQLAADPRHLGALPGFVSVLHTWAQNLAHHPHIHCIATAGGLSVGGTTWIDSRKNFLLPVKVLGKRFKHLFMRGLKKLKESGSLGQIESTLWYEIKNALYEKRWVVYAKRPFAGPEPLFRYLGRYTHRVGLSNHRLLSVGPNGVTFSVRAREPNTGLRKVSLSGDEFLRRFLLHVLPKGFVRIRHYGLYTSAHRASRLALAHQSLALPALGRGQASTSESFTGMTCLQCGRPLEQKRLSLPLTLLGCSRAPPQVA